MNGMSSATTTVYIKKISFFTKEQIFWQLRERKRNRKSYSKACYELISSPETV